MKNLVLISFACVVLFSCSKDNAPVIYNDGIIGKWELSEYYVNPGAGMNEWQTPDAGFRHTVEFKRNGDFVTIAGLYYEATAYEVPGSSIIKFLNASQQVNGSFEYFYSLEDNNSILIISPQCFEGCAYKYVAIK